jgi:hypothetical protein
MGAGSVLWDKRFDFASFIDHFLAIWELGCRSGFSREH